MSTQLAILNGGTFQHCKSISGVEGGGYQLMNDFGITAVPVVCLIDADRRMRNVQVSPLFPSFMTTIESVFVTEGFSPIEASCTITSLSEEDGKVKQLIKIVDFLGRECLDTKNTPLIYVYDDGSTERVFKME